MTGLDPLNAAKPPPTASFRRRRHREYSLFAGVLRSELALPELAETNSPRCDWWLRVATGPPLDVDTEFVGARTVGSELYRLWRTEAGWRLHFSHAGDFCVSADGGLIDWHPSPGATADLGRAVALGPVLALCLEAAGCLCLHGSAVAVGDRAIAFVGAKHYGKSTLAVAMASAGARFLSDDLLAVEPGPPALLRPGVAGARLWADAVRELRVQDVCARVIPGVKATATGFPSPVPDPLPLDAIYILDPTVDAGDGATTRRTLLPGAAAMVALAHQTKLADSLVGYRAAGDQLRLASAVAGSVPVWSLSVVRDFRRLGEVVQTLLAWHGQPGRRAEGARP